MAKINKIYPSFYNGVTQQPPELALDTQCKEMVNCIPGIIKGLRKRPPVNYVTRSTNMTPTANVFHTYDRGEDEEEYIFVHTGLTDEPLRVYNKAGVKMTVTYEIGQETEIKSYINTVNMKGLTVQDRTWLLNKDIEVSIDNTGITALSPNYDKVAYYWLKRGAGDRYNPYNYAVYLDGVTYEVDPNKPASDDLDPATGAEDSDVAASILQGKINGSNGFVCQREGSILKIYKSNGSDFTFNSWDSWGNQASEGWKGSVNKITDLPKDMAFSNVFVEVVGEENNDFTSYYIKWNGSSWQECPDPKAIRGYLSNMPIACDRVDLVDGIATFNLYKITWDLPAVGNIDNNPDPSIVGYKIQDLFFYKNRLGLASSDSIVLSETANYENFYIKTAISVLDKDPIDVAIATNQASKIYYAKPFNNSLYIFTKYSQFELRHEGFLSPTTVSIDNTTNYPMAVGVEPQVVNNSLFFISVTNNKQQLREYVKDETLTVKGVDLNVITPDYLEEPITSLVVNGVLGYVLCCTANNTVYLYNYKEDGKERVQSAWSKWKLFEDLVYTQGSFEYHLLDATLLVIFKTETDYRYHVMQLDDATTDKIDTTYLGTYPYMSSILLPDYYPHINKVGTPKDKILLKKVGIQGTGNFSANIYRKDYNRNYVKEHTDSSMRDLDLHVASKVGNVDITLYDNTVSDFNITSVIVEGLFSPTSKEMR